SRALASSCLRSNSDPSKRPPSCSLLHVTTVGSPSVPTHSTDGRPPRRSKRTSIMVPCGGDKDLSSFAAALNVLSDGQSNTTIIDVMGLVDSMRTSVCFGIERHGQQRGQTEL